MKVEWGSPNGFREADTVVVCVADLERTIGARDAEIARLRAVIKTEAERLEGIATIPWNADDLARLTAARLREALK